MEKISLIIPIYNNRKTLKTLCQQVQAQTYANIELVLIDDGSTDGSGAFCDQYRAAHPNTPIIVVHQHNQGVAMARNQGVAVATGTWLTFVDADDQITTNYVAYLYELAQRYDCVMATCNYQIVRGQKTTHPYTMFQTSGEVSSHDFLKDLLYQRNFDVAAWGKLYKRCLFKDLQYPKGALFEDTSTTFRLALRAGKIAFGHQTNYHYVIRPDSITTQVFSEQQLTYIQATRLMARGIVAHYPDLKPAASQRLTFAYISVLTKSFNGPQTKTVKAIQQKLQRHILGRQKTIWYNTQTPRRTRLSLGILQTFGVSGLRVCWQLYERYRNR